MKVINLTRRFAKFHARINHLDHWLSSIRGVYTHFFLITNKLRRETIKGAFHLMTSRYKHRSILDIQRERDKDRTIFALTCIEKTPHVSRKIARVVKQSIAES